METAVMGSLCSLHEMKGNSVKTLKNLTYKRTSVRSRWICDAFFNAI